MLRARMAHLLLSRGVPSRSILAVTFTQHAAQQPAPFPLIAEVILPLIFPGSSPFIYEATRPREVLQCKRAR